MDFSRQEYWSVLSFPTLGNLPDSGIEPVSLVSLALVSRFFIAESPGKLHLSYFLPLFVNTLVRSEPGAWCLA